MCFALDGRLSVYLLGPLILCVLKQHSLLYICYMLYIYICINVIADGVLSIVGKIDL